MISVRWGKKEIYLLKGDITQIKTDAIVNAANKSLLGGGGVDDAIHRAAGAELLKACRLLNGCETGMAKATKGFHLAARFVIHTVGPIWKNGNSHQPQLLASCYSESVKLAEELGCTSIAFPNISTGVYGFPKEKASLIAFETIKAFNNKNQMSVYFVCFDDTNFELYKQLIAR